MHHTMRKLLTSRYLAISAAALLLYALGGFVLAPLAIRWYVPQYAQHNLHCRASVETVRVNPFLLTLEMHRFSLHQADAAPLAAFARLYVDLEISSLFHWAVVVKELELENPEIHVVIAPDGSINFAKLAAEPPQLPEPAPTEARTLPLLCRSVAVKGGRIGVVNAQQSVPAEITLQELALDMRDLATVKGHNGTYHLAARTEAGESLQWDGEIALAPLRAKGTFSFNAVQVASLWQFFRDSTNLEQPVGTISVSSNYRFGADNAPRQMMLEGLHVVCADLSLKLLKTDQPFLQLQQLALEAPRVDLAGKQVQVGRLLVAEGLVDARISESGAVNLAQLLRASRPPPQQGHKTPVPAAPSPASGPGAEQENVVPPLPSTAGLPFTMQVDAVEVANIALTVDDRSRAKPFKAAIAGVDLRLQADLALGADTDSMVFRDIAGELRGASVHSAPTREPLFAAEKVTAAGGLCNLGTHSLTFARVAISNGRLDVGRDAAGTINWQQMLQSNSAVAGVPARKPAPDAGPAWGVLVRSVAVDGFSAKFSDLTTRSDAPVLSLQNFKASLADVDGKSPMGFNVGFQVEQGGAATVSGTINPSVPSLAAEVQVSGVVLTSLQPYLEPYVTLKLQSASVAAQGRLRYGMPGDAQKAVYEGNFSLDNLRLADAGSPGKPYLSWDSVQLPQCRLTLQPNRLDVQEIKIFKPVGELIIGEDKTLNLARVLKGRPVSNKKPQPATPQTARPVARTAGSSQEQDTFPYRIARVQVAKGNMVFADLSLRPRFMTRIHDLRGSVTDLSSAQDAQARMEMSGQVDQYGTANINGSIRPNDFGSASHVAMVFRNVAMKSLSPYSGKFAGRLIKSGTISADLSYTLQDYKMAGENTIVIDNLSLGEQVDTPDAASLPLELAIALLQDARGRIDIGLPVSGDLKDPHFSIGSLVWKLLTNLITQAVSAPFRALGHLFGGGAEKFAALVFDPGSADLLPPEQEKLLQLAEALERRPQLTLVVQGRYSPGVDGPELQGRSIRRMIVTRLGTKLGPKDNPEPLSLSDSSTQRTLEKLYAERFGTSSLQALDKGIAAGTVTPRPPAHQPPQKDSQVGMLTKMAEGMQLYKIMPGGKSGEQAVLWAGELYARLVADEQVAEKTFLQLAEQRAQSVVVHLESQAHIPGNRVRVKAAAPLADNGQPAVTLELEAR